MADDVKHLAIVEAVNGQRIRVKLMQKAACASCAAKGHCNSSEVKEQHFELLNTTDTAYQVGQRVWCTMRSASGLKAVGVAFLYPFLCMLIAMILCVKVAKFDDGLTALIALGVLTVYYLALFLLRPYLSRRFALNIEPM